MHKDNLNIFNSFSKEYINEISKKIQEIFDKWQNCKQKKCYYHPSNYNENEYGCADCDEDEYYERYVNE